MIIYEHEKVNIGHFPDGTLNLKVEVGDYGSFDEIIWKFENNEEMIVLYYLVKHIRSVTKNKRINLHMPFVPNGRMDRVKDIFSEVFTLKYFCEFINSLNFDNVYIQDPHSNVTTALINNVYIEEGRIEHNLAHLIIDLGINDGGILFFPDEGACKRYSDVISMEHAFGVKKRDWETGEIKGLDILGCIPKEPFNVLIIDDICSKGTTFFHSAKKLKELGADKIYLYITHCENSILEGELINSGLVEHIYTTGSIFTKTHPLITVL